MAKMVSGRQSAMDEPTNVLVRNVPAWFSLGFSNVMCLLRQVPQKYFLQSQSEFVGGQYDLRRTNRGDGYGKSCRV